MSCGMVCGKNPLVVTSHVTMVNLKKIYTENCVFFNKIGFMETAKNLPIVINPHGGPWARDGWGFNPDWASIKSEFDSY